MADKQKYKLIVSERQMNIIQAALDLFCRLLMGQFNSSLWNLFISRDLDHDAFERKCDELKLMVFPELHLHEYYGVGWKDDSRQQKMQIAYEIEAVVRHELWKRQEKPDRYVTSAYPPLHYSDEPFIRLEDVKPEDLAENSKLQLKKLRSELKDFDERTKKDIEQLLSAVCADGKCDEQCKQMYFTGITETLKIWKSEP
jgi:hypothetical protein